MRFVRAESRDDVLSEVAEELRLSGVTNDIADQVVADYLGLNRTDARCLDIIERLDGVSAGRLASEAGLSTGAVTTVLDRLERAGSRIRATGGGSWWSSRPPRGASCSSSTRRSPRPPCDNSRGTRPTRSASYATSCATTGASTRPTRSACAYAGGSVRRARRPRSDRPARPPDRLPRACARTGRRARSPSRPTARGP